MPLSAARGPMTSLAMCLVGGCVLPVVSNDNEVSLGDPNHGTVTTSFVTTETPLKWSCVIYDCHKSLWSYRSNSFPFKDESILVLPISPLRPLGYGNRYHQ